MHTKVECTLSSLTIIFCDKAGWLVCKNHDKMFVGIQFYSYSPSGKIEIGWLNDPLCPSQTTVALLICLAAVTRSSENTLLGPLEGNTWISNPKPGSFCRGNDRVFEDNANPVNLCSDSKVTIHSAVLPGCSQENTTCFPTHTGSSGGVSWATDWSNQWLVIETGFKTSSSNLK